MCLACHCGSHNTWLRTGRCHGLPQAICVPEYMGKLAEPIGGVQSCESLFFPWLFQTRNFLMASVPFRAITIVGTTTAVPVQLNHTGVTSQTNLKTTWCRLVSLQRFFLPSQGQHQGSSWHFKMCTRYLIYPCVSTCTAMLKEQKNLACFHTSYVGEKQVQ